jgi:outer membrane lipoprotein carrier protein
MKHTRRTALLFLPTIAVAWASWTIAAEKPEEILQKVRDKYETITDAEIRFTQRVHFPVGNVDQSVTGTLLMKKGNKYRVDTEDHLIVTDGITVWSYARSQQQVLVDHFKLDEHSLSPDRILRGSGGDLTPAIVGHERLEKQDVVVLKLLPRDESSLLKSLKLWVSEGDYLVRKAEVVDLNGKETVYQVLGIKTNGGISDAKFSFTPPEGVEVVDLR